MQVVENGTIFEDDRPGSPERTAYFPSLARLADGRMLCLFQIGSAKAAADETLCIMESGDEGGSWTRLPFAPGTAWHGTPGSLRLAHLVESAPGTLMVVATWVDRSDPNLTIAHAETNGCLPLKLLSFRSVDGGLTWGEARELEDLPFPQPEVSGPIVNLGEGHLLLPVENQKTYFDPAPIDQKSIALLSHDGGETWPEWHTINHDPKRSYWCTRMAILPASRTLMALSWAYDSVSQRDLPIHVTRGSADGRQWSPPQSSGVFGQLATPLALDDQTVLMGYVHRHEPASIRLRLSRDGGLSWDATPELVVYSAPNLSDSDRSDLDIAEYYQYMTNYTFGWNPMLPLSDGSVFMAYFSGSEEAMAVHYARIRIS